MNPLANAILTGAALIVAPALIGYGVRQFARASRARQEADRQAAMAPYKLEPPACPDRPA